MKYLRWGVYVFLIASILYSARELLTVAAAAKRLAAGRSGALPRHDADGVEAAEQVDVPAAPAPPAPRAVLPRADHAEVSDTNSGGGKVFHGKGGPQRPVVHGGGVIIDSDGTRLELAPPDRPRPAAPSRVFLAVQAVQKAGEGAALPALDDPAADLATRKRRAEVMLGAGAVGAFALVFWARRWRPS